MDLCEEFGISERITELWRELDVSAGKAIFVQMLYMRVESCII